MPSRGLWKRPRGQAPQLRWARRGPKQRGGHSPRRSRARRCRRQWQLLSRSRWSGPEREGLPEGARQSVRASQRKPEAGATSPGAADTHPGRHPPSLPCQQRAGETGPPGALRNFPASSDSHKRTSRPPSTGCSGRSHPIWEDSAPPSLRSVAFSHLSQGFISTSQQPSQRLKPGSLNSCQLKDHCKSPTEATDHRTRRTVFGSSNHTPSPRAAGMRWRGLTAKPREQGQGESCPLRGMSGEASADVQSVITNTHTCNRIIGQRQLKDHYTSNQSLRFYQWFLCVCGGGVFKI